MVMAKPKLSSVPIRMYSVSFRSLAFDKSPKRNTDFAAIKKPTPSQWFVMINMNTKRRSRMPIYAPASANEASLLYSDKSHLDMMVFMMIEDTLVMHNILVTNSSVFGVKSKSILMLKGSYILTTKAITIRWAN